MPTENLTLHETGFLAAALSGILTVIGWVVFRGKHQAEIHKLEAEVDDLHMGRMIKELDSLRESNDWLAKTVESQRKEIDKIREQLMTHVQHVATLTEKNQELTNKNTELERRLMLTERHNPPIL